MILDRYIKQPAEVKDYDVDYSLWLTPMTDSILNAVASVVCITNPANTSFVIDQVEFTPSTVKVWVSGGTDQEKYKVSILTRTVGGRIDESELLFTVKDF